MTGDKRQAGHQGATTTMASLMRGGVGIFTVLFTREEVSSILAATTRSRPRGTSAATIVLEEKAKEEFLLGKEGPRGRWRRGTRWEGSESPRAAQFFPFKDFHLCLFVPNFTFASDSEIRSCIILFCIDRVVSLIAAKFIVYFTKNIARIANAVQVTL